MDVTLHGKRDFAGVIKLRILRWGDHFGLLEWAQNNHKGSHRRDDGRSELDHHVSKEAEGSRGRKRSYYSVGVGDGGKSHKQLLLGRGKKQILSWTIQKEPVLP